MKRQLNSATDTRRALLEALTSAELSDFAIDLIDTCNVRTFKPVAVNTAQGQIVKLCFAAVLTGNDVINLKRGRRRRRRQVAIFILINGPKLDLADEMSVQQRLL